MNGFRKILLLLLLSMTLFNVTASSSFLIKSAAAASLDSHPVITVIKDVVNDSKAILNAKGLKVNHVELINHDSFPVFYLDTDSSVNLEADNLIDQIAGKNGYTDYKVMMNDRDSIEVYCNRTLGRIERTVSEKRMLDFLLDQSQSAISVDEARIIAENSCQKPEVGVRASYAEACDVVINNTRYYCFDLAYQLPKIEKEIITYKKVKKKRVQVRRIVLREARIKTIPAVMINTVDRTAYEAVKEKSDDGRVEYYLTPKKIESVPLTVSSQ